MRRPDAESAGLIRTPASEEQTEALGREIGALLRPGDLVCLRGDLGTGKTTLVRGIHAALGCAGRVRSPSFTTMIEYGGDPRLNHFDLFRYEAAGAGFLDEFEEWIFGDAVVVVEWAERLGEMVPRDRLDVCLEVAGTGRRVRIQGRGSRGESIAAALAGEPA